jgi:hypothetical protein
MLAGYSQHQRFSGTVEADGAGAVFPAGVDDVFEKNNEGTFFGNILDPASLNPNLVILPAENDRGVIIQVAKGTKDHTGLGDNEIYLYEDAWACHDPRWTQGDAYLHHRNCAIANVQPEGGGSTVQANLCVSRPLGECNKLEEDFDSPNSLCQIYDSHAVLGDFDRSDCLDGRGNLRRFAITTYLDEPCDLIGGEQRKDLCGRK